MKQKNKSAFSELGLLYSVIVWGSSFFILKETLQFVSPTQLVGYRFLFAALIAGTILIFQRKNPLKNWKQGFVLGLMLFLINASQTLGIKFTSASNSAFITSLFIIFVPGVTYLYTKKLSSPKRLIPIFVALLGLWLLTGGIKGINNGDLITLITAMVVALQIVTVERIVQKKTDPFILNFQQLALTAFLSLLLDAFLGNKNTFSVDPRSMWNIIYLATICTVIPLLIQFFAQKHVNSIKASLFFSLEPVFAALFAWTLGHELFVPEQALGGIVIVIAVILSEIIEKRSNPGTEKIDHQKKKLYDGTK